MSDMRRINCLEFRMRLAVAALFTIMATAAQALPTSVTVWTDQADRLGNGNANWRSLAIMHRAMHDALNAADPVYARWDAPARGEPESEGAMPEAAMEAAAATALSQLHPDRQGEIMGLLTEELARLPPGAALEKGRALGEAIGATAVARRADDGFQNRRSFAGSDVPGVWRPTPPDRRTSGTTSTRPFLFARRDDVPGRAPPQPGSAQYLSDVEATRRIGGGVSTVRTPEQADAAIFWAYQSTQRGYIHWAATLIDRDHERYGLAQQARIMAQVSGAMADSAVLIWAAKEHWVYWRPIDAIRSGQFGVSQDSGWQSFIETPPHPEYPSGHASDCYVGAGLLAKLLTPADPLTYTAQSAPVTVDRPAEVWSSDMGTPPAPVELRPTPRDFPTVAAAAQECADARIWAGAHFPSANEESRRIAGIIVARALAQVPPIAR